MPLVRTVNLSRGGLHFLHELALQPADIQFPVTCFLGLSVALRANSALEHITGPEHFTLVLVKPVDRPCLDFHDLVFGF